VTALIGFLRELEKELGFRADGWARDASNNASTDIKDRFAITAAVLREVASAIGAAAKRTLLA
jgi:hypothetical protein